MMGKGGGKEGEHVPSESRLVSGTEPVRRTFRTPIVRREKPREREK